MRERTFPGAWAPPYLRPVFHLTGRMLLALAAAMLLPAGVDALTGDPDWRAFLIGSGITFACAAALTHLTRCRLASGLTLRQAFLLTPVAWTTIALFGAIPLYISDYSQLRDHFTNAFFEPLWNNKYISNIQITLSETVGVEERGGYYDTAGALRDMGQNHMLQMVTMMAMEPPSVLHPEAVRDEKVKVLKSMRLYKDPEDVKRNVVRGQYIAGESKGKALKGYLEEDKVPVDSKTETYFAAKIFVDNFRWAGVPFYVRTGKRLPAKATEVVVEFKNVPDNVYLASKHALQTNLLVFRVNPMEGVYIKFNAKAPGSEERIVPVAMDFCHSNGVGINTPEAYERLVHDAVRGDSTYFTRWDEVAAQWRFVDRIASAWNELSDDLQTYPAGTWGPEAAAVLLERDGHRWWPVNGQRDDDQAIRLCTDVPATT